MRWTKIQDYTVSQSSMTYQRDYYGCIDPTKDSNLEVKAVLPLSFRRVCLERSEEPGGLWEQKIGKGNRKSGHGGVNPVNILDQEGNNSDAGDAAKSGRNEWKYLVSDSCIQIRPSDCVRLVHLVNIENSVSPKQVSLPYYRHVVSTDIQFADCEG